MFISGATGVNAALMNGFFEPTQEKGLDGRVLYAKRGDAISCIRHRGGVWEVLLVSCKDKGTKSPAYVEGGCALDACTSRVWKLINPGEQGSYNDAPSVKLVTGEEAQRQVRGCPTSIPACAPHLPHPSPFLCVTRFCFCAGR